MNAEFFEALTMLEKERGLTSEYPTAKYKAAIAYSVKRDNEMEDEQELVDIVTEIGKGKGALVR